MNAKHTPTPWAIDSYRAPNGDSVIVRIVGRGMGTPISAIGRRHGDIRDAEERANAELIVRAVNAHDALVEALKAAHGCIKCLSGRLACNCVNCQTGEQIAAALALATKEPQ